MRYTAMRAPGTVFRAAVGEVAKNKMPNATHMVEFKRPDVPKGVGGQVAGGAVDGELRTARRRRGCS